MGSDIHAYIEYRENITWFCFGRVRIHRDYLLFGVLAGVRCEPEFHFNPKGIPAELSYEVREDFYVRIDDQHPDDEHCCSTERAIEWGRSIFERNGQKYTTHPDWHSASYLGRDELYSALFFYTKESVKEIYSSTSPAFLATVAAATRLPEGRLVFWFDN